MTDYFGIAVNGFFTGLGVIVAQRVYRYWEERAKRTAEGIRRHSLFEFFFCKD